MNQIAFDTNVYTKWARGELETVAKVESVELLIIPFAVVGELWYGFNNGSRQKENMATFRRLTSSSFIEVAHSNDAVVDHYARLQTFLRQSAKTIPINDLWIADVCMQRDVPLFTFDKHFDYLPQLQRV